MTRFGRAKKWAKNGSEKGRDSLKLKHPQNGQKMGGKRAKNGFFTQHNYYYVALNLFYWSVYATLRHIHHARGLVFARPLSEKGYNMKRYSFESRAREQWAIIFVCSVVSLLSLALFTVLFLS